MSSKRQEIGEQLSAYLDGELSEAEARRLEEAVRADAELAGELNSLRAVRGLLRELPRERAPAGMTEGIVARAERSRLLTGPGVPGRRGFSWPRRLAVAAAVLIAVGAGLVLMSLPPKPAGRGRDKTTLAMKQPSDKPAAAPTLPEAAIAPINLVINTDNLAQAQSDVERVFASNSLLPITTAGADLAKVAESPARANFYRQTRQTLSQVRYDVVVSEDQLQRVFSELNGIRANQRVAQVPLADGVEDSTILELARADESAGRRFGYAAKTAARGARGPRKTGLADQASMPSSAEQVDRLVKDTNGHAPAKELPSPVKAGPSGKSIIPSSPPPRIERFALGAPAGEKRKLAPAGDEGIGLFEKLCRRASAIALAATEARGQRAEPAAVAEARQPTTRPASRVRGRLAGTGAAPGGRDQVLTFRQQQAPTLAGANLRQLVVILNDVEVRGKGR